MEPEGEDEAVEGALDAYLLRLRALLRAKDAFAGENERIKWVWRLHQLRRRRQLAPELWDGTPTRLLAEIEAEIARLPTDEDGERGSDVDVDSRRRDARVSIDFDLSDEEKRGSVGDRGSIPMMENGRGAADDETSDISSWTAIARLLRRASAVLMGSTPHVDRDSLPVIRDSVAVDIHEEEKQEYTDYDPSYERDGGGEAFAAAATASSARLLKLETDSPGQREEDSPANRGSRGGSDASTRGLRQSVPNLLRSFVSYLGLSMEETFLCQICYDYTPVSSAVTLSNCQHAFCRSCLQNYLEFKISEAQVYPTCFFQPKGETEGACAVEIAVDDIRVIVSDEAWQKYTKFKFNKENELARQCPFCDHSQLCAGPDDPACTCAACGREFCFLHSNAHEGRTCAEYDKKMLAIEKLNHALISEIAKPCPGCQNHVEKTGGCNQMKCVVCNTSFCWICLAVIDDNVFPEHFQVRSPLASYCVGVVLIAAVYDDVLGSDAVVERPRVRGQPNGRRGAAEPDREGGADDPSTRLLHHLRPARARAGDSGLHPLLLLHAVHRERAHDVPPRVHLVLLHLGLRAARAVRAGGGAGAARHRAGRCRGRRRRGAGTLAAAVPACAHQVRLVPGLEIQLRPPLVAVSPKRKRVTIEVAACKCDSYLSYNIGEKGEAVAFAMARS